MSSFPLTHISDLTPGEGLKAEEKMEGNYKGSTDWTTLGLRVLFGDVVSAQDFLLDHIIKSQ